MSMKTDEILKIWDNSKKLDEQTEEALSWYQEEIAPLLSYRAPMEVKKEAAGRLGLEGEITEESGETDQIPPIEWDAFARPVKWIFSINGFSLEIENFYKNKSVNWNLDYTSVKIAENGKII